MKYSVQPRKEVFFYKEDNKQYLDYIRQNNVINKMEFVVREHLLGKNVQLEIVKDQEEIGIISNSKEIKDKKVDPEYSNYLDFYLSFIIDQSKTFLLVLQQFQKFANSNENIRSINLLCKFFGPNCSKNFFYTEENLLFIENIAINGCIISQKDQEQLLNSIKDSLGLGDSLSESFFCKLLHIGTLEESLEYNIDRMSSVCPEVSLFGVSICPYKFCAKEIIPTILKTNYGTYGRINYEQKTEEIRLLVEKYSKYVTKELLVKIIEATEGDSILDRDLLICKHGKPIIEEVIKIKEPSLLLEKDRLNIKRKGIFDFAFSRYLINKINEI